MSKQNRLPPHMLAAPLRAKHWSSLKREIEEDRLRKLPCLKGLNNKYFRLLENFLNHKSLLVIHKTESNSAFSATKTAQCLLSSGKISHVIVLSTENFKRYMINYGINKNDKNFVFHTYVKSNQFQLSKPLFCSVSPFSNFPLSSSLLIIDEINNLLYLGVGNNILSFGRILLLTTTDEYRICLNHIFNIKKFKEIC